MSEPTKRCPFCGSCIPVVVIYPEPYVGYEVECRDCHAKTARYDTEDEAVAAWNTRASLGSGTCELHDCDGSFSVVNRPVWRCDCGAFVTQYTDASTYHKPRFCPNCGKAVER